jgi:LPS sulfotransferase NodH
VVTPETTLSERSRWGEHFHPKYCASWEQFTNLDPLVTKMHVHWLEERGVDIPVNHKFVRLHRHDRVRQTWSLLSTAKINKFHAKTEQERSSYLETESKVRATREEFFTHLDTINRWERLMQLFTCGRLCLDVFYEDLVGDTYNQLARIMCFLEVPNEDWHNPGPSEFLQLHPLWQ